MALKEKKNSMQQLITSLGKVLDIEIAVFDRNCCLMGCTPAYGRQKGSTVHKASVEEVMQEGKLIVNEPGRMATCIGCRFKDNCPATIEILNSIDFNGYILGVVALTSFTEKGHDRISHNPAAYLNLSQSIAEMIGNLFQQEAGISQSGKLDHLLQSAIEFSKDPVMVTDHQGRMIYRNEAAQKLFSFCNMAASSLQQILPPDLYHRILSGEAFEERWVSTAFFDGKVKASPTYLEGSFVGAALTFQESVVHGNTDRMTKEDKNTGKLALEQIVGKSRAITELKKDLLHFADAPSPVLITGDTGTGKELVAAALHANSSRQKKPFIAVNCASIPETLFESELFGYMEGAFTGAKKGGKPGRFQMAHGGTLFLDEIGEMPLSIQAKLLRVLQDYKVEPLGSTRSIPVDVRVVAATNQDLEGLIREKKFRADLFYRINVIPLRLPKLKDRKEDIPALCRHFLQHYRKVIGRQIERFSEETLEVLQHSCYDWPGNIRELENAVEYAVNRGEGEQLTEEDLPRRIKEKLKETVTEEAILRKTVVQQEQEAIKDLLEEYGWHQEGKEKAAQALGISVRTLYRKLKK